MSQVLAFTPSRRGAPYTYPEVLAIYLTPKSRDNAEALAAEFGRTPDGIDFAWRWIHGDVTRFPKRAFNRLHRLVKQVRADLGDEARGRGRPSRAA